MNKINFCFSIRVFVFIIPWFMVFVSGCGLIKETPLTPETPIDKHDTFLEKFASNQTNFEWFSARFTGNVVWRNQSYNISGNIRIKKDEAIYISISPVLGIEIARLIVTPDTLKFLNRLESTYYIGHIGFLNSMLHSSFDYAMLQSLLIGNDFQGYDTDGFAVMEQEGHIILHDPERYSYKNPRNRNSKYFDQYIWVDPEINKIKKNIINEPAAQRTIKADYNNFEQVQGEVIPSKLDLFFSDPIHYANLSFQYLRITLNEPQQMHFSVPSRYKPIGF